MFSKILVKLIDQAIVPALLLLTARIVSVVVVAKKLGLDVSISQAGFVLTKENVDFTTNTALLVKVNSFSLVSIIVVLSVGLLYILIKSYIFHDTHIAPYVTARLFSYRLSAFIQSSYDLYSQGTIWLSYLYLIMFVSGVMAYFNMIYAWIFYFSLILTVICTALFIFDVEKELNIRAIKKPDFDDDEDALVIKLEESGVRL